MERGGRAASNGVGLDWFWLCRGQNQLGGENRGGWQCGCAGVGDIIFLSERAECAVKKKCKDFVVCVEKVLPNVTVQLYSCKV